MECDSVSPTTLAHFCPDCTNLNLELRVWRGYRHNSQCVWLRCADIGSCGRDVALASQAEGRVSRLLALLAHEGLLGSLRRE